MARSRWVVATLCLTLLTSAADPGPRPAAAATGPGSMETVDTLITGGIVIDGTGAPPRQADVGLIGDRIAFVGRQPANLRAAKVVDATGQVVAPGFIDPHTHSDRDASSEDTARRLLPNHLLQGVTSIVVGNDGGGDIEVADAFADLAEKGAGPNIARFVGLGAVRRAVLGDEDRAPDRGELRQMEGLVARAMCEGALGLSAGLFYAPQSFAGHAEVTELAREAAARGGLYETHLRDEGSSSIGLMAALEEALEIARSAGLPLHVAHIKALGADAQGSADKVVARIELARAEGMVVTADQYPWEASSTRLASALVPRWAMAGGRAMMLARLEKSSARLRADMAEQLRIRGGAGAVLMVDGSHRGKRLDAIAAAWGVPPVLAAIRLLKEEPGAGIASFNMADADIEAFARQPWVVASSDATQGHPRAYGSFARRWRLFVREKTLMTEAEFVHRASGLTAEILGFEKRGTLRAGNVADVVMFDPHRFAEAATYEQPERIAVGMLNVWVGGRLAVENGRTTGLLPGQPLPRTRQENWECRS